MVILVHLIWQTDDLNLIHKEKEWTFSQGIDPK
jgi:hypothetical protein